MESSVPADHDDTHPAQMLAGRSEMVPTGVTKPTVLSCGKLTACPWDVLLLQLDAGHRLVTQLCGRKCLSHGTVFERTLFKPWH